MCFYKIVYSDSSLKATTSVIFYGTTCITMVMFYQVARVWPRLAHFVARTEALDPSLDQRLARRCNATCAVVLTLALSTYSPMLHRSVNIPVEHILSLLQAFAGAAHCFPDAPVYEGFVRHFYPWVFNFLPYSPYLGIMTQFLHFQSTFIWNFSDLFVICMSYYLTSRLDLVNQKLLNAQGKVRTQGEYLPELFWRSTREEYGRATQLVRKVDEAISGVVFMSFANNLFFVCFQLFNTLENGFKGRVECSGTTSSSTAGAGPGKGYEAAAYFLFSLVYLISRSVAVSLVAAQVHSASAVPAPVLYDVPSPVYCIEVQRFLDQVNGDHVALSGLQFFSVTRGLLLTVAGTIVTYELVMVQFNAPSSASPASATAATLLNLNESSTLPMP
ncbi:hypothetical protein JYU34_011155 [Plutella xylostella]|uniref:Gustatory receptor n=1 Tax=Plutella xylostella TaxID=51655 RepID=A0ABQ7QG71_PLUXY|nr:hypothetical protein JYU34_011155 [Plutella xylostella]